MLIACFRSKIILYFRLALRAFSPCHGRDPFKKYTSTNLHVDENRGKARGTGPMLELHGLHASIHPRRRRYKKDGDARLHIPRNSPSK